MSNEILPASLIEMISLCDNKGFDVFPIKEKKGIRFIIWKEDKVFKRGEKHYKNLIDGQREVYSKLYQAIL